MVSMTEIPIEERIFQLFQHVGIQQAHLAARLPKDWQGFAAAHPQCVASLTLLCPQQVDHNALRTLALRPLVFIGDRGPTAEGLRENLANHPDSTVITLQNYQAGNTSDVVADRVDDIGTAMLDFLDQRDQERGDQEVSLPEGEGQVAGILYRIQGSGPPLVLFPLQYAPSQWDPVLPRLSQRYCTITLSGANVGSVSTLEARAKGGYLEAVQKVVDEIQLQPGERVLDVGCGPGSLDRWLAHRTGGANPIVGVDVSTFLLREAAALVKSEGLEGVVEFREASGEMLPFPDDSFDVSMSFTVIQFVDADRMLGEMIRVTRPGGRIAVLARGDDRPNIINAPLRAELKAKAEAQRSELPHELGCRDASLYRRFQQAGLTKVKMFPQLVTYTEEAHWQTVQSRVLSALSPEEAEEYRTAVAQAQAEGSFFIAEQFHCAVGVKA